LCILPDTTIPEHDNHGNQCQKVSTCCPKVGNVAKAADDYDAQCPQNKAVLAYHVVLKLLRKLMLRASECRRNQYQADREQPGNHGLHQQTYIRSQFATRRDKNQERTEQGRRNQGAMGHDRSTRQEPGKCIVGAQIVAKQQDHGNDRNFFHRHNDLLLKHLFQNTRPCERNRGRQDQQQYPVADIKRLSKWAMHPAGDCVPQ
jgi:hypothetical protein